MWVDVYSCVCVGGYVQSLEEIGMCECVGGGTGSGWMCIHVCMYRWVCTVSLRNWCVCVGGGGGGGMHLGM